MSDVGLPAGEGTAPDAGPGANNAVGGPWGRFAAIPAEVIGRGRRAGLVVPAWQPVAAVASLLAAVMVALGALQKSYCFANGWGGTSVFWRACYSDLPNMYVSSGLAAGRFPYEPGNALTQPVGSGFVLWLLSLPVPGGDAPARTFVAGWAVVAALLAMAVVIVTAATARTRPSVSIVVAVSPLLITLPLVSADLFGVLLVSVALLVWSRERPVAAGVVFAAAILSRTYAVVVLAAVVCCAVRAGRGSEAVRTVAVAAGGAAAVLAVLRLASFDVVAPYASWLRASAEFGSSQYLLALAGVSASSLTATVTAVVGWVMALLAGAVMALSLRRRPRIAEVAVVMIVIVMVTAKAVPPQWALWLLPLVALARLPWRITLPWMATECVYFVIVWMHIPIATEPTRALPAGWYAFFLTTRLVMLLVLAWSCYRQAAARGPVRVGDGLAAAEVDDVAGVAAGERDRLVIAF